ncbi:MAG: restriction endonuclease subunit S [Chloroflexi bacterium]|nr:restriction endonuclease subunit S [Chloroflexota bacterium]
MDKVPAEDEVSVRLCNYTDVYNNELITLSLDFRPGTATSAEIEKFHLQVDDVVITKDSESWDDIGIPARVAETAEDLVCGYHLAVLRPRAPRLDGRFLLRCLQAKTVRLHFEMAANGVTRFGIPKDEIGKLPLPLPPLPQQQAIADYLDRETVRLDSLVEEKKHLLELLAEKRHALITRAVTRGLNPAASLCCSCLPWLGQSPAHWPTKRLAFLFRERDERGEPALPLLEVSINTGVVLREFSDDCIEAVAADFNTYKVARKGDIAFNKMRMWQGAVGMVPTDGLVSPDYTVAAPLGDLSPEYAQRLFRTEAFSAECCRQSHGIVWDRLRLYWEGFRDIRVAVPPLAEQRAIVAHVAAETAKLDALRTAAERTMGLLKERRAALIAAAVTGKIAVPEEPENS